MISLRWSGIVRGEETVIYDGPIRHGDQWDTFPLTIIVPNRFGGEMRQDMHGCVGPSGRLTVVLEFTVDTVDTEATE